MNVTWPCPMSCWNSKRSPARMGPAHGRPARSTVTFRRGPTRARSRRLDSRPRRARGDVAPGRPPHHFRLLSDGLLGYAWPKWVKAGEKSEFRVHSVEPYQLSLWRYGIKKEPIRSLGWFDEHGPRATMQITPDGD